MPNYRYQGQQYGRQNTCGYPRQGMQNMQQMGGNAGCNKAPGCPERREYAGLAGMPVAMAYVPWQEWYGIYDLKKGFCKGTIFEELNKPFQGMGVRC